MGSILESYDAVARVILQALLNSFWPGVILLLFAWLALRVVDRASATTRHAIWIVCLIAIAALPFLPVRASRAFLAPVAPPLEKLTSVLYRPAGTFPTNAALSGIADTPAFANATPGLSLTFVGTNQSSLPAQNGDSAVKGIRTSGSQVTGAGTRRATPPVPASEGFISRKIAAFMTGNVPGALIAIWIIVSTVLIARVAWSYVFLFRLRRQLGLVSAEHRERARQLAEVFGIERPVRLFSSQMVGAPMTIGWLRPLIILPPDVLRTLGEAEIDSILAHELAHIKRWDYLTNLLQRLAQAVFFFHPAVWVIGRQLSLERELACDDWAIKMTGEPRRYARCLTRLVETMSSARSFAAASGIIFGKHVISRRIEMILNRDRNATTSVSKGTLYSAIGSAGLAVVLATFISPVIAIPLPASTQLAKATSAKAPVAATKAQLPATPAAPQTPASVAAPAAPTAPVASEPVEAPEVDETAEFALLPVAPEEPVFELLETVPVAAPVAPRYSVDLNSAIARTVAYAPAALNIYQQTPATAPRVRTTGVASIVDGRSNETPAIPEAELIAVLSEVVRKDTDANVRSEALRGIYRYRTDAAINALLSLYDGIADVKTKGEILAYLMRSEGDNSKAVAKLLQIARTEKDETLRGRALSQLSKVKGDEGANHLIAIYDGLQDPKEKQTVIRYLGANKTRKAADKLIQIAKNDADPNVRQSAIRSLYAIDNRMYLDLREKGFGLNNKVSVWDGKDLENWAREMENSVNLNFSREEIDRQRERMDREREQIERHMEEAKRSLDGLHFLPEIRRAEEPRKVAPKEPIR